MGGARMAFSSSFCTIVSFAVVLTVCETWRSGAMATFSTKKAYSAATVPSSSLELNDDNCVAVRLDLVARHGTRYPSSSAGDFIALENKLASLRQFLPATGPLAWLSSWVSPFTVGESGQLAIRGQDEHYHMGKRFLRRLPTLLGTQYYSAVNFTFMSTGKPRCLQSASSFSFGVFQGSGTLGESRYQPIAINSRDLEHDPLLRFFDMCPLYKQQVKRNPEAFVEVQKFINGPEMREAVTRVSSLLGVPANRQFSPADLVTMYKAFAFEVAILNSTRFSGVFTAQDGEVLEYAMDLNKYYKNGYGHSINWQISCTLMDDILDSMEDAIKAAVGRLDDGKVPNVARSVFRFGHAETVIPLLCYMGLYHDAEPLRADNFERQRQRLFRGADMAPFSGNIGFMLYQCPQSGQVDPKTDVFPFFSVKLLLNEREVPIPGCMSSSDGSCRFDRLRKLFPTKSCNLKQMCKVSRHSVEGLREDSQRFDNREAVLIERGRNADLPNGQRNVKSSQMFRDRREFGNYYEDDDDSDDDDDDDDDDDWKRRRHRRQRRTRFESDHRGKKSHRFEL